MEQLPNELSRKRVCREEEAKQDLSDLIERELHRSWTSTSTNTKKAQKMTRHQRQEVSNKICNEFWTNLRRHTTCEDCIGTTTKLFPCTNSEYECIRKTENIIRRELASIHKYANGNLSNTDIYKECWFMSRKIYYVTELARWDTKEVCYNYATCETCDQNIKREIYTCVDNEIKKITKKYKFDLDYVYEKGNSKDDKI